MASWPMLWYKQNMTTTSLFYLQKWCFPHYLSILWAKIVKFQYSLHWILFSFVFQIQSRTSLWYFIPGNFQITLYRLWLKKCRGISFHEIGQDNFVPTLAEKVESLLINFFFKKNIFAICCWVMGRDLYGLTNLDFVPIGLQMSDKQNYLFELYQGFLELCSSLINYFT